MNGRVYDPELGRFLSADPFVQAPYDSQSYNRYSYVFNNPLSYTDPSGFTSNIYKDYGGRRGDDDVDTVDVIGSCPPGATCLSGMEAYNFSMDWQNYMNRYQQSMVKVGGSPGSLGGWGSITGTASFAIPIADACSGDPQCIKTAGDELAEGQLQVIGFIATGEGLLLVKLASSVKKAAEAKKVADALLVKSANKPIASNGLSAAARKLDSHAKREGGTFEKPTGSVQEQNKFAEKVLREIIENTASKRTELSRGGFEIRAPNGQGVRFDADGSFSGFLDPRR